MLKICYAEEDDSNFIQWTSNLLHKFLSNNSIKIVSKNNCPDLMLASVWRRHEFPNNMPVVLISNENWQLWPSPFPISKYAAVVGITPPPQPPTLFVPISPPPFIPCPYEIAHFGHSYNLLMEKRASLLNKVKKKFCCFVVSNSSYGNLTNRRFEIFSEISTYKAVDSAGLALNNTGYLAPKGDEFLEWISEYKFMICPENSFAPGYITEKPLQAHLAGTIPIYCGGNMQALNPAAYINAIEKDFLEKVVAIDNDEKMFAEMSRQSLYKNPISLNKFEEKFEQLFLKKI